LREAMEDRLHQPFRKHLIPGYDEFVQSGYQHAALGVCISGSGSTVLGLVREEHARGLVEAWKAAARAQAVAARVRAVGLENRGALVQEV
ncbi:MAG: homoserine kinase, partial [Calditrichaeota bacterium]